MQPATLTFLLRFSPTKVFQILQLYRAVSSTIATSLPVLFTLIIMAKTRLVVLISGHGTNLQALINACANGAIPNAEIVKVVSSSKNAYGLKRAQDAGIPTEIFSLYNYKIRHSDVVDDEVIRSGFCADLSPVVLDAKPDLIVCAGWMLVMKETFLEPLNQANIPIINLHPALPGQFNGKDAITRAYSAFQAGQITHTGLMIHYVIREVDMGEPIVVKEIEILQSDTESTLADRMHTKEWELIVEGTRKAIESLKS
jgi:phosphoribosylglycinamide formyltransferase